MLDLIESVDHGYRRIAGELDHVLVAVFLVHDRLPLRSTLFPYTTLFRSRVAGRWPRTSSSTCASAWRDCARDRKSTRLNSSHQIISYAVFCLKKKRR